MAFTWYLCFRIVLRWKQSEGCVGLSPSPRLKVHTLPAGLTEPHLIAVSPGENPCAHQLCTLFLSLHTRSLRTLGPRQFPEESSKRQVFPGLKRQVQTDWIDFPLFTNLRWHYVDRPCHYHQTFLWKIDHLFSWNFSNRFRKHHLFSVVPCKYFKTKHPLTSTHVERNNRILQEISLWDQPLSFFWNESSCENIFRCFWQIFVFSVSSKYCVYFGNQMHS